MRLSKYIILFLTFLSLNAFAAGNQQQQDITPPSKEQCLNDPDAPCWCSQLCGWRKKTSEDHPVYIENDPYGKHCYCKQWDYDHYEDNCINGKNIKQPKGAK